MYIQNGYTLHIFIKEFEITAGLGTKLLSLNTFESIEDPIPSCSLTFLAHKSFLEQGFLLDGSPITIYLKSETYKIEQTYYFRLFSVDEIVQSQEFLRITIKGLIDFFEGYTPANSFNAYGPSSEIVKSICQRYNLINDIDTTNDKQLWIAGENNVYQFLAYLAKNAYLDDLSCFFWCIDRHRRLLFKNITSLFGSRSKEIYTFTQSASYNLEEKVYYYTNIFPTVLSGINNINNGGYGGYDYYFDLNSYSQKSAFCKKTRTDVKYLNVSKELSQGLAPEFLPFDVGNFNPNYYTGRKQNKRLLSLYSTYLSVISDIIQNYRLGQVVNFLPGDTNDPNYILSALTGVYIINAVGLHITERAAISTISLAGQGLNSANAVVEVY